MNAVPALVVPEHVEFAELEAVEDMQGRLLVKRKDRRRYG